MQINSKTKSSYQYFEVEFHFFKVFQIKENHKVTSTRSK